MAPGTGFEPVRPIRVTDLAGLLPTRLGHPGALMVLLCLLRWQVLRLAPKIDMRLLLVRSRLGNDLCEA